MGRFFIIGYPCCGKTRYAKRVAKRFSMQYVDSDDVVEQLLDSSIVDIFESQGEVFFRESERQVLLDYCSKHDNFVMATGGGLPCFFDNLELMIACGTCLYIQVPPKILANRIVNSYKKRPRFIGMDQEEIYQKILIDMVKREPYYIKAQYIIDGLSDCEKYISNIISSLL